MANSCWLIADFFFQYWPYHTGLNSMIHVTRVTHLHSILQYPC